MPYEKSTQLLEMTLESRLNWEEHIDKVRVKAKKALNSIKVVAGKQWGVDRRTLKNCTAICRLKVNYGSQLYSTASQ